MSGSNAGASSPCEIERVNEGPSPRPASGCPSGEDVQAQRKSAGTTDEYPWQERVAANPSRTLRETRLEITARNGQKPTICSAREVQTGSPAAEQQPFTSGGSVTHWSIAMRVGRLCAACALLVFEPRLAVAGTPDCDSVRSPLIYAARGSSQRALVGRAAGVPPHGNNP